jgi:hypothetical protein
MPRMVGKRAKILSIDHVEDLLGSRDPPSHSLEEPDVSPRELAVMASAVLCPRPEFIGA